jgi:hypothetical protein
MEDMLMRGITQEGASLAAALQRPGSPGKRAPQGDQTTDIQTPVRIEVIENPVLAGHRWQLGDHRLQMGSTILTGPRQAKIPEHLARRDDKGGQ